MNRLIFMVLLGAFGIVSAARADSTASRTGIENAHQGGTMHVTVRAHGNVTRFELNNSTAAKAFYRQLPLTIKAEPYGDKEVIFYPPEKLATDHTPAADAKAGTLAYYAPWGDVVMFHQDFGTAAGLYELGHAVSGAEHIRKLSGTITIEKAD